MSKNMIELTAQVEQLLVMLELLEKQGDRSAKIFADGVRHRLAELQKAGASASGLRDFWILCRVQKT